MKNLHCTLRRLCGFVFFLIVGCKPQTNPVETGKILHARRITVAAASDLQYAFDSLISDFHQQHPGMDVDITYGSSGNLFAQLSNRAPYDIFFSADLMYPQSLVEHGFADEDSFLLYAIGQIVVWCPKGSPIDVERLGMHALTDPNAKRVAIANPRHAPYGRAAEAALKSSGLYEVIQERLVFGENVAQTAQFLNSGAADVGIISHSLATAPAMREKGKFVLIPMDAYPSIEQASIVLNWARDRDGSNLFRDYVIGSRGRAIMESYGFILPEK